MSLLKFFLSRPANRLGPGLLAMLLLARCACPALAMEVSGSLAAEGRLFVHTPQFAEQRSQSASVALDGEFYHRLADGSSFILAAFARLDSADKERSHVDLREANYLHLGDDWQLRLGLGKVFWGACEFVHLVDIINQTDLVEALDGEEKLGQPMAQLALVRDWGVIDLFWLPAFRERTFAGRKGRLRSEPLVDVDHPLYESGSEELHQDVALRYSHWLGPLDFGLSWFRGTSREPFFRPGLDSRGRPLLRPLYEQITQTGIDLQGVAGAWLLKGEALYRSGFGRDFAAATCGFEYTCYALFENRLDLGIIGEYVFDDRQKERQVLFDNDLMVGLRLAFNNAASSEILLGLVQDLDHSARLLTIEAGHRLNNSWRIDVEAALFMDAAPSQVDRALADDDFVKMELRYYF
ncbi:MAG: hypothetical protein C0613_03660 [Desulfobulbaceae bacterium]|nr:MAG: hypothetical protein C0613_03660 [Desulfobulbaceae bacterium]